RSPYARSVPVRARDEVPGPACGPAAPPAPGPGDTGGEAEDVPGVLLACGGGGLARPAGLSLALAMEPDLEGEEARDDDAGDAQGGDEDRLRDVLLGDQRDR